MFIIGGILGAVFVGYLCAETIADAEKEKSSLKNKFEEERKKREVSDIISDRYRIENSRLKEELALEKMRNSDAEIAQKSQRTQEKRMVHRKSQQAVHRKKTSSKDEEDTIRCIRL